MTEQELQEQNDHLMYMKSIEEECAIDINKKIEHPPVAISFKNKEVVTKDGSVKEFPIPIGTYGNFSFIQAPPKSMKTFFVSLLGSAFCNPNGEFTKGMSSFRGKKHFVHFDTEQGDWHSQRVFKRVEWMNKGLNLDFYHTFALRKIGYRDRIDFIQYYLDCMREEGKEIGLIVIDGIADLVSDVNNIEESNACIQKIMEWSANYKCHIICVIHSNFGNDKPTGHLGSFLEKKTETQIQLEANTVNKEWTTVKCRRSRGYSFETFSFQVNALGLPEIVGDLYDPLRS